MNNPLSKTIKPKVFYLTVFIFFLVFSLTGFFVYTFAKTITIGDVTSDILYIKSNVGIGTNNPSSSLSVGSTSQFQVNSSGNLIKINNVPYNWPTTQGGSNTFLKNNDSGNLIWATITGGVISVTAGAGLTASNCDPACGTSGPITGTGTLNVGAGTGISVGTDTVSLTNTGVTAATYGSTTQIARFTVDVHGRIISASNVTITGITGPQGPQGNIGPQGLSGSSITTPSGYCMWRGVAYSPGAFCVSGCSTLTGSYSSYYKWTCTTSYTWSVTWVGQDTTAKWNCPNSCPF